MIKRKNGGQLKGIFFVFLLLLLVQTLQLGFAFDSFSAWFSKFYRNWVNILLNNSYTGIVALGMTLVILSGGIDLAVGSTLVAVGAFVMSLINTQENGILLSLGITGSGAIAATVLLGLLMGALLGLLNGIFIANFKVPPFIVTLATMQIYRSVTQFLMKQQPGVSLPEGYKLISKLKIGSSMLLPILYWALLAGIMIFITKYTVFGKNVYATGSNERAAVLSGIDTKKVKRRVYALMGLLVAIASIIQTARIGSMDYASAGSGYEMNAIAAVIIGGTSMSGGKGSIIGTVLGTLILAIVNNLLTLIGVDPFLREAFKGAIVLSAVFLQRQQKNN